MARRGRTLVPVMSQKPYVLKLRDIEVRPERGGLHVAFSSERPHLGVDAHMVEDAFSRAFDERAVRLRASEQGRHNLHIAGLDMEQEGRVRAVLNMAHIFHTDGDECPDLCLALDWQMNPNPWVRTEVGEIEYRAKWDDDPAAARQAAWMLYRIVRLHAEMRAARHVIAPPSSHAFAGGLAGDLAKRLGVPKRGTVKASKIQGQIASGERDFDILCERQVGTIEVQASSLSGSVLVVDDLYYSGGTIREITRQCRALGAKRILALTVTKSRRHHRQT